jgi:hypothetical protein
MAFDSSGGASLDGEPPASASPQPTSSFHGPRPCIATCYEHRTAWSEPRSTAPPCFASRPRPSRPRAEHAASPLTSSSTTASLGPAFRSDPRRQPLGSDPAIPSSKTTASSKPGRLRSTGALSSAPARLRAWLAPRATTAAGGAFTPVSPPDVRLRSHRKQAARDHEEPATVPATSPPRAGFERPFRTPKGAEQDASRRPLQPEQPTSTTTNHPSPDRGCRPSASSLR